MGRKIEDLSRICNVIGAATRVVRIPEVLYHYRMRGGSITATADPRLMRDWMKAADDREEYIDERFPELRGFMKLQQLNFFANLDYETMRQSLIAGLKIDPEDADALRRRIDGLRSDVEKDDSETIPDALRELLGILRLALANGVNGLVEGASIPVAGKDESDDKPSLADLFHDMREDWRQMRIQWVDSMQEAAEEHHEREGNRIDGEQLRREERLAERNGVIFESH